MMKNKRGQSEMLKYIIGIIIGVIGLLLLFKAAGLAYSLISGGDNKEKAINQIDDLIVNMNKLGIDKEANYTVLSPRGWQVVSYTPTSEGLPNECTGKNCLCICPEKSILRGVNCNKGICKITEKEVKIKEEIKIPLDIVIKSNEFYEISKKEEVIS